MTAIKRQGMVPVVTSAEMKAIDRAAIGGDVKRGFVYMRRAGRGLFREIKEVMRRINKGDVAVICGKGNNGGDGYVAARLLREAGCGVVCLSLCDTGELSGEARRAFEEFTEDKNEVRVVRTPAAVAAGISRCVLVVDAMLGTGTRGDPRGIYAGAVRAVNSSGLPVVSADTPSGLDCDTGMPGSPCVRADVTVAMGFPKIGQLFYPGRGHAGKLIVQYLGYPERLIKDITVFCPERKDLRAHLPRRRPEGSKFDHGLALLVCGSRGMTGAAVLSSTAALRSGCGMTHLAVPESMVETLSRRLVETVIHPLPETPAGTPSLAALDRLLHLAGTMQAVCIGPGISHERETSALVREFVARCPLPVVLDADGINAFKGRVKELKSRRGCIVMTPHRGEWQRLFGRLSDEPAAVIKRVREESARFGISILLKGSPSVAAGPEGRTCILPYGNSALAKAGSGDVLSGVLVSLLAQGAAPEWAAALGAAIHGDAGTLASGKLTEYSVVASDVVKAIPRAIKGLLDA